MGEGSDPALPLTESTFYILLSLALDSKHGYAILKHVESLSEGQLVLSASTLYSALVRLQDQGLIQRMNTDDEAGANPGLPRKAYALTEKGRHALEAGMARLRRQVRVGQRSLGGEFGR